MKIRTTILAAALVAVASAASAANLNNPDNDSAAYFAKSTIAATGSPQRGVFQQKGDISSDGQYVYSGTDRGWVLRSHSYVFAAGKWDHAPDCLAYNEPKASKGLGPTVRTDRGA